MGDGKLYSDATEELYSWDTERVAYTITVQIDNNTVRHDDVWSVDVVDGGLQLSDRDGLLIAAYAPGHWKGVRRESDGE